MSARGVQIKGNHYPGKKYVIKLQCIEYVQGHSFLVRAVRSDAQCSPLLLEPVPLDVGMILCIPHLQQVSV